MSEATKVELGFWEGIIILSLSNFFLGLCVALHFWLQVGIVLTIAIPFSIWGLRSNRKSYMLQARIAEIEKRAASRCLTRVEVGDGERMGNSMP